MQLKIFLSILVGLLLTGCSHIYGKQGLIKSSSGSQYMNAHSEKPLQIPSDLNKAAMQEYYPIPASKESSHTQAVSITPPGSESAKIYNEQHLQKRGFFGRIKDWFL